MSVHLASHAVGIVLMHSVPLPKASTVQALTAQPVQYVSLFHSSFGTYRCVFISVTMLLSRTGVAEVGQM